MYQKSISESVKSARTDSNRSPGSLTLWSAELQDYSARVAVHDCCSQAKLPSGGTTSSYNVAHAVHAKALILSWRELLP